MGDDQAASQQPLVPSPSTTDNYPELPRLVPEYVRDAAQQLKRGTVEGGGAIASPILCFLETLAEGDEPAALTKLARLLRNYPLILSDRHVWGVISQLYQFASPFQELNKWAEAWLRELLKASVEGMTFGSRVIIEDRVIAGHPGQTPALFQHIDDRDGWLLTEKAKREYLEARRFRRAYDDLMSRLELCVRWAALRRRYRELRSDGPIYTLAEKIMPLFEEFKRDWDSPSPPLPMESLRKIARAGLKERRRGNPRDTVARGLLATLDWSFILGRTMTLSAGLIKSTLESLHKRGIGRARD